MVSKIEHLDIDPQVPYDEEALLSGDPVKLAEEQLRLVKFLQEILEKISIATNHVIDLGGGDAIYSKLKQADGTYPLGTWRLIQIGNNWERQVQLVIGEWTFAGDFERPT